MQLFSLPSLSLALPQRPCGLPQLPCGLAPLPLGLQTAGDAASGSLMPFGLDLANLQQWTLIYLGLSSLAFVIVWVVGFLRR